MTDILANTVYTHRFDQQLTQQEVADAVGVSRQTIIAIEKGNYVPSVSLALRLAKLFSTSVETLFHHEHN